MKKTDLVAAVATKTGLTKKDVEAVVDSSFATIAEAMTNGDKVSIFGFGTFETRERAAYMGRNPHTNETIEVPASITPAFKAAKSLKDQVNGKK